MTGPEGSSSRSAFRLQCRVPRAMPYRTSMALFMCLSVQTSVSFNNDTLLPGARCGCTAPRGDTIT